VSAAEEFDPAPEFLDAMRYAAFAVLVGPDPDDPDHLSGQVFRLTPTQDRPRRAVAASDGAAMLRQVADELAVDGEPL
jgi:hypothetical protein